MSVGKVVVFLLLASLSAFFIPSIVRADKYGVDDTVQATGNLLPKSVVGASSVPELIGKVIAVILSFLAIIFFLLIFYAGILWMTARGNSEAVTKAKDIMEAAVIGLLIVVGSYAISRFVFDNLVGSVQSGATGAGSTDPAVVACRGKQLQDVCSLNGKTGFCNPGSTDSVVVCIPNS
jgi:cbb3-type cytochrome oxidase subunit 3